jgi:predicted heme/steroid binding protein
MKQRKSTTQETSSEDEEVSNNNNNTNMKVIHQPSTFRRTLRTLLLMVTITTLIIVAALYIYSRFFRVKSLAASGKDIDLREWASKIPHKRSGGTHAKDWFKLSLKDLSHYTGEDENLPILIGIKGRVYDVTRGKAYYGPAGGYHFFAGRDGTRSFSTGCFDPRKEECTTKSHVYDDLNENQKKDIDGWVSFYDEKYDYIGDVVMYE